MGNEKGAESSPHGRLEASKERWREEAERQSGAFKERGRIVVDKGD